MALSNTPVVFPAALPRVPFIVRCVRSAPRSGLNRNAEYRVEIVAYNATTKRGEGAKGYIVSTLAGETIPLVWNPNRFEIVED